MLTLQSGNSGEATGVRGAILAAMAIGKAPDVSGGCREEAGEAGRRCAQGRNAPAVGIKTTSGVNMSVTREQVLAIFIRANSQGRELTTREVSEELGEKEYAVRAAVSWLKIGKHLERKAMVSRVTINGFGYVAASYAWSGKVGAIDHVRRDPCERPTDGFDDTALAAVFNGWIRMGR